MLFRSINLSINKLTYLLIYVSIQSSIHVCLQILAAGQTPSVRNIGLFPRAQCDATNVSPRDNISPAVRYIADVGL